MKKFDPVLCHEYLVDTAPMSLSFNNQENFMDWKNKLDKKFRELIGRPPEIVPLNTQIEYEKVCEGYKEIRFVFTSEKNADVPCHLLIPKGYGKPYPVVICLQGHTTGMHLSMGRKKSKGDKESIQKGDRDIALQALNNGYAALVLEQRCFGERADVNHRKYNRCSHASMVALLLGRTMILERAWDVSRAIDVLEKFDNLDMKRIGCTGNSGGGKISYYAACLDKRISVVMPSCSVCSYKKSNAVKEICHDTFIPGALEYFDMADLAGLIAPRPLIIISGKKDRLFPTEIVKDDFKIIQAIYKKSGVPEKCRHVVGNEGHKFYPDLAWPVFNELSKFNK